MKRFTVLCVEDEPNIRMNMIEILNEYFGNVISAKDGKEALEKFGNNKIDLLITDIKMPKIDGFELIEKVRAANSDIPILIMSAYTESEYFVRSIKLKVDGYIIKPIDFKQLTSELEHQINNLNNRFMLKRNEKLLKEYKEVLDRSSLVSKTDINGKITYVNEAFCKISGFTKDELIGKSHNIVRHPDMEDSVFEKLWETIKGKKHWQGIIKNKTKEGGAYYVNSYVSPILNEENEIEEFISIRTDITELELYKQDIEKQLKIATKDIVDTQKEVVYTMGAIGETRSKETGLHVKRVAEYSYLLAKLYGLSEDQAELLKQASPMHDIGKVGIPDHVLNKPGKLDTEEWEIMKTHASLGYEMLKHSKKDILKAASTVAHEHHEKWDGSGYPRGLKEEEIHIFGRITAIADVFDALGHDRCYKKAWPMERILELYKEQKGKHFDPKLIDILFDNLDSFLEIKDSLED